jgi:hypothetical protein
MKILLGDLNAKLGREDTFKPTIGNESLREDSNDNGVRVVNFATPKNLVVKSTMFPHRNIHKCTWTSPDRKTHNQIDHILIDRRWHLSILDVLSFRGADCNTDHYLVVAKVRERLAVIKQAAQKVDAERFILENLSELEDRKQYQIRISNRFAALENLNVSEDKNRARENIKDSIKISAKESLGLYERKQHKPWFDEECSKFLDRRKQAKLQWLQNPNQSNVDNLNNVRREASRHLRNKKKEYLKAKINELETNSKNKNIRDLCRGISDFKKGYKPRTNVVKDEKGDLVADSHSVLGSWRNHFFQLLIVRSADDIAILADSEKDMNNMLQILEKVLSKCKHRINKAKT